MSKRENDRSRPTAGAVGHGNPPMQRRFKKSGNPGGRPKGSKNRKTIVELVVNEMHVVTENGKRRQFSTLELVLVRLRNLALQGENVRAFDELHRLDKSYQPQVSNDDAGYALVPAPMTAEEWLEGSEKRNEIMDRHGVRTVAEAAEIERRERKEADGSQDKSVHRGPMCRISQRKHVNRTVEWHYIAPGRRTLPRRSWGAQVNSGSHRWSLSPGPNGP